MPVTDVHKDPETLTMAIVADFSVPLPRLWNAYLDPRQIERFWGPPSFPATFYRHDGFPGGESRYVLTGTHEQQVVSHGAYWEWIDVKPPESEDGGTASFEVLDGFLDDDGSPNRGLPSMRMTFHFEATADGSRLTTTTYFDSTEDMAKVLEMGAEEGTRQAMAQIDDVLADLAAYAAGEGTTTKILDDTRVRISRVIRGTVEQVWRAHHEAELVKQWMLGPDGWTMPVCDVATEVGQTYRYEWENEDGGERFGFTGELLESVPPQRAVTTEAMIGMEGPGTRNEMTLTPHPEGTLMSIVITYPTTELRDTVLATGMVDGMETSYQRLESLLAS